MVYFFIKVTWAGGIRSALSKMGISDENNEIADFISRRAEIEFPQFRELRLKIREKLLDILKKPQAFFAHFYQPGKGGIFHSLVLARLPLFAPDFRKM